MSILGEYPFLDRLDRGASYGLGGLNLGPPPGFRPHTPRLWRPTVWGSPPPPPCPPLPPQPHTLPLCPEPCHLPALAGVGVTHLFDYMASARLWYPWYYKGGDSIFGGSQGLDGYGDVSQGGTGGGKELPSRSLKADRLKERQDLSQVLHIDKEHAAAIQARKTTTTISTQT
ncbi:hypothetical protein V1264_021093 [Littorina saxatilis]|uniref:Uncharacterized protein n=2 Tax=Littorina saxatilis TaxID=31220 RepID=A0AAN9BCZ3_9CAEN